MVAGKTLKSKPGAVLPVLAGVGFVAVVAAPPAILGGGSDKQINGRGERPHLVVLRGEVPGPWRHPEPGADFLRSFPGKKTLIDNKRGLFIKLIKLTFRRAPR